MVNEVSHETICDECGLVIVGINWCSQTNNGPWRDLCASCHGVTLSRLLGTPTPVFLRGIAALLLALLLANPLAAQSVCSDPHGCVPASVVQQLLSERDDRPYQLIAGVFVTTAMADLAITEYRVGNGTGREAWIGAGLEDRPVAFGLLKGGLTAGSLFLLSKVHQHHPRAAFWIGVALTSVEVSVTARNARGK